MRRPEPCRAVPLALALLLALGACSRGSETDNGSVAEGGASGPATASRAPVGIVPTAEDAAGSGVPGPGAGATAVGGVAGRQESGGAPMSEGKAPAPTGGDGAASASMR